MRLRPLRAIVVAYHGSERLDTCLATLEREVEITVVDNSSSPTVRETANRRGTEYLDAGQNLGFGSGVNLVLRRIAGSTPEDVLLLNPDAILAPHDFRVLAHFIRLPENARVAAVSPRLIGPDGREQRVVWPFPTPARGWADALGIGRVPARHTFVVGAVLLLRWEAVVEVGLFDERFFLYAEEADWQRRALDKGWVARICPDATAEHEGAGTSEDSRKREVLFHAGQETYIRKWHGRAGWMLYRTAGFVGAATRALLLGGDRRAEAARRAVLYLRGPRSRAAILRGERHA